MPKALAPLMLLALCGAAHAADPALRGYIIRVEEARPCDLADLDRFQPDILAMNPLRRAEAERGVEACMAYREAQHRALRDISADIPNYIGQLSARLARLRLDARSSTLIVKH